MARTLAALMALSSAAWAQDWVSVDARSKAVGNAGVAFAEGATAGYWNPSLLASGSEGLVDLKAGFGATATAFSDIAFEGDFLADVDHVRDLYADLDFSGIQTRLNTGAATTTDIQNVMKIIDATIALGEEGNGVIGHLGGGLDFRFGPFGLSYREVRSVGIDPFFDFSIGNSSAFSDEALTTFFGNMTGSAPGAGTATDNLSILLQNAGLGTLDRDGDTVMDAHELATQAQLSLGDAGISDPAFQQALVSVVQATIANDNSQVAANTLYFNGSGVEITSVIQRETGVSFGLPVLPGWVTAGITLKEIITESYYTKVSLRDLQDGEAIADKARDEFDKNKERSNDFNMDLGLTISPLPWVSIGAIAKNVFPMEIDFAGPGDLEFDPQYRVGVMVAPLGLLKIGMDIDVNETESDLVDGFKSRMLGGGVELSLPFVRLRGGVFGNLSSDESKGVYSGGIGFSLLGLSLDVNGQMAPSDVKVEAPSPVNGSGTVRVPERVSLAATLGFDLKF